MYWTLALKQWVQISFLSSNCFCQVIWSQRYKSNEHSGVQHDHKFNFIRNFKIVLKRTWTILYTHHGRQWMILSILSCSYLFCIHLAKCSYLYFLKNRHSQICQLYLYITIFSFMLNLVFSFFIIVICKLMFVHLEEKVFSFIFFF